VSNLLSEGTGIVVGVGVGAAAAAALEPAVEIPKQEAWAKNPNRILDVALLARLVAQGGIPLGTAHTDAERDGYLPDKVDALVYLSQTVPGGAEALSLWRKGLISDDLFLHTLVKAGLDQRYAAPIVQSKLLERVGLGDIAYGVVRGILPAPSWVPVPPPASGDKVPRFPQVNIDPLELANQIGYDENMLKLMVGRSGLSMAPIMAANALFRGIIGPDDFLLAIAEGDLRTEWAEAVRDTARQILTAGQYAELELRGFLSTTQRRANTAKHGMSDADSDLLYDVMGRSIPVHQITTGLARGGEWTGQATTAPEPYLSSLRRGNLRPEYYSLAYANRYSYPSAFVVRALLTDGAITQAEGEQIFLDVGWRPDLAKTVAQHYAPTTSTVSDPHIAKANTQLWTTLHRSYIAEETDDTTATTTLATLGVAAAAIPEVLRLWQAERALIRKQLSAAQVKKAYAEAAINPATGTAWTQTDALDALIQRGYSMNDATTLLEL
jgi:hypothetical protein